jgi:hypothetical protein
MTNEEKVVQLLDKIDKKLAFIIGEKIKIDNDNIKDQIKAASKLTQDRHELALMLGVSPNHAAKELSLLRKGDKK